MTTSPEGAQGGRDNSKRFGLMSWLVIIVPLAGVCGLFVSGLAATWLISLVSDVMGMAGAALLVFGTWTSLPNRMRVEKLVGIASSESSKDKFSRKVSENFRQELSQISKADLLREWNCSIIGAYLLVLSFLVSLINHLLPSS